MDVQRRYFLVTQRNRSDTGITMKRILLILAILLYASAASAQCTGGGTTWNCPAGTTPAQVNTMISAASNNAMATFATGSYTWTGTIINFSPSKGLTLICSGTCTVSSTAQVFALTVPNGTVTNLYRISGFTFNATGTGQSIFWADSCNGCQGIITQFRFDHNIININAPLDTGVIFFGDGQSNTYLYGVVDHNTITTVGPHPTSLGFGINKYETSPPLANTQGTANNLFLEDNILKVITTTDVSSPCMTDAWGFASIVVRHNTITNCLMPVHDLGHNGGPQNWEVYNNQNIQDAGIAGQGADDGYRMVHHQGAQTEIFWNNSFKPLTEPHSSSVISALAGYVDGFCSSYPCGGVPSTHGPQPGRDSAGVLRPIYGWGNFDATNGTVVVVSNESAGVIVAANRDIYTSTNTSANTTPSSPFDGTVGVGFGTLANRPATCTHSNPTHPTLTPADDGHGGVGYAVETVVGTIGASIGAGVASDAVLYTCTALNTWTVQYTPFTYPHPLVTGGVSAPSVNLTPATHLDFGNVNPSCGSGTGTPICPELTMTVTNTGTANLIFASSSAVVLTSVTPNGAAAVSFDVALTCGNSVIVTPGNSCTIIVLFAPVVQGVPTSALITLNDNAGSGSQTFTAIGIGLAPSPPATSFAIKGSILKLGNEVIE